MAKNIRLRVTAIREYDANPAHYTGCSTPEEMAALDATGDVWSMLDHEDTQFTVEAATNNTGKEGRR